jgi:hypothetical protein
LKIGSAEIIGHGLLMAVERDWFKIRRKFE